MSQTTSQAATNSERLPRYAGEQPMPQRTPTNDQKALKMAKLALQAKEMRKEKDKQKRQAKNSGGDGAAKKQKKQAKNSGSDGAAKKQKDAQEEQAQPNSVETGPNAEDPQVQAEVTIVDQTHADPQHEASTLDQETIDSPIPWPELPFAYGNVSEVRLPLKSMYDGTGQWPKRTGHGGKKYSWSNIGFPFDESLLVPDFEENTHIDTTEPYIADLATDVSSIRFKDPKEIADGAVECIQEHNRTIETFKLHGRSICRVKFSDVNAFGPGSPYSSSKVSKSIERRINDEFGVQPDLATEHWVTAHVLLSTAGQIGGRTQDYWTRARSLAQQQLYLNSDLKDEVRQQIESGDREKDPAFSKMLAIVKKACPMKSFNLYHQAKRNDYATDNGFFHKVENVDIILVLDQSDNLILFQCCNVFDQLLTKAVQKLVVQSFETYSTCTPIPWPEVTRHGLHWIKFLAERPELDFRNPENDPRVAKSGNTSPSVR